jgi:hypothetical protein
MEIDEPVKRGPEKPSEPSLDPKLRQRLQSLMDPSLLHSIATRASDPNFGYEPTVSAGLFFLELISRSKTARDQILTVVAALQPIMRQIQKAARTSGLGPKFLTGKATNAEKDALARLLSPLSGGYWTDGVKLFWITEVPSRHKSASGLILGSVEKEMARRANLEARSSVLALEGDCNRNFACRLDLGMQAFQ